MEEGKSSVIIAIQVNSSVLPQREGIKTGCLTCTEASVSSQGYLGVEVALSLGATSGAVKEKPLFVGRVPSLNALKYADVAIKSGTFHKITEDGDYMIQTGGHQNWVFSPDPSLYPNDLAKSCKHKKSP